MPECQHSYDCPFYKNTMRFPTDRWERMKKRFCLCNPEECARIRVLKQKGKMALPEMLAPDNYEEMNRIITQKESSSGPKRKFRF